MDVIDAFDLRGLHGPIRVVGFNFYTDRTRLAELLSLEESKRPPYEDHINLIDSEAPDFCVSMEDMSIHLLAQLEMAKDEGETPDVWVIYRGGVLVGCLEGVSVSYKLLDPPYDEWMVVTPEDDPFTCSRV